MPIMPQPLSSSLLLTVPGSRQCTAGGGRPSRAASSAVIIITASCEQVSTVSIALLGVLTCH